MRSTLSQILPILKVKRSESDAPITIPTLLEDDSFFIGQ